MKTTGKKSFSIHFWKSISSLIFQILLISLFIQTPASSQIEGRKTIKIPDILGYQTLKCDFHIHTVFSDGEVWPHVRAEEIWLEGLDAFSITDHIEYLPHKSDLQIDFNRSFELAEQRARELDLIIIKGAEITREMPPGHFNSLFLTDVSALDQPEVAQAFEASVQQEAFIFWNHPGWRQPYEVPIWYDEHTQLYQQKIMQGIEVVNYKSYYPLAFQWALEKKLTIICNSDIHSPIQMAYDLAHGEHRPMTLVFSSERSAAGIKAALINRRTVAYFNDLLIGEEKYLKALFEASVTVLNPEITFSQAKWQPLFIKNNSEIPFKLVRLSEPEPPFQSPPELTLEPERTMRFPVEGKTDGLTGDKTLTLKYRVENLLIAPEQGLPVEFKIKAIFE